MQHAGVKLRNYSRVSTRLPAQGIRTQRPSYCSTLISYHVSLSLCYLGGETEKFK